MSHLKTIISDNYLNLSDTNKLISDVILEAPLYDFTLNIASLAALSYCSSSAIIKYINYFGYSSYKVFKADLNKTDSNTYQSYLDSLKIVDVYLTHNNILISQLIEAIKKAQRVYLFAAGQSQLAAIDFMSKSNKMDPSKYLFESSMATQKLLLATISHHDLVIFISNSGEARELIAFNNIITNSNKYLVTNRSSSSLGQRFKKVIDLNNTFEDPLTFKNYSRESKYTLLYFFDRLFELLYLQ
ncbi:MAG: MurR/RpiR family transcriptional regulator [Bacilli bacterium]